MTLLANLRRLRISPALDRHEQENRIIPEEIGTVQLARLNVAWAESLRRSPWARELRTQLAFPARFESWDEVAARAPVVRKSDLRAVLDNVTPRRGVLWLATGGTTAEPLRFPVFTSETRCAALDLWLGRRRCGITPSDRLFLLWGHSHLFGSWRARMKRRLTDLLLGYTRWSAYRLSEADLAAAAEALLNSQARYVLGYATALDRFARAAAERAPEIRRMGLRAVIATAEAFPRPESRAMVEEVFGCPVVMEYGSVETGPVAYERIGHSGYDVFWTHHRLEQVTLPGSDGPPELFVTCLFPRALPLLRYAVGDRADPVVGADGVLTEFAAIHGRSNEVITLPGGMPVHSEIFTHAVRDVPALRGFQVVKARDGGLPKIRYEAPTPLDPRAAAEIRRRLALVAPELAEITLERADMLQRSVAGKHRMIVDET